MLALLENKATAQPCRVFLGFFYACKYLILSESEDEKIRKSVLHALIERIQAYPDRKVEVKFRIGEKTEGTGGGQKLDPHESTYPVPATFQIRVSDFQ